MGKIQKSTKTISLITIFFNGEHMRDGFSSSTKGEENLSYYIDEHDTLYILSNEYTLAFYSKADWLRVRIVY